MATDYLDGISYQWYRDGIALPGENDPSYQPFISRDGIYVLAVETATDCFFSEPYNYRDGGVKVEFTDTLCLDETYEFDGMVFSDPGTYYGHFEAANGCDSTVVLTLDLHDCGDTIRNLSNSLRLNFILAGVDINGDNRIQYTEAAAIDTLSIPFHDSLPWQYEIRFGTSVFNHFVNLEYLDVSNHRHGTLDLDSLRKLKYLDVSSSGVDDLKISNSSDIEYLNIGDGFYGIGGRDHPDITHLTKLKYYSNRANRSSIIDLSFTSELVSIDLRLDLSLDSLILGHQPNLKSFQISSTSVPLIDFSVAPNLEYLKYWISDGDIDFSQNTKIKSLIINRSLFPNIDVSHLPDLERLSLEQIGLQEIDVSQNPKLKSLDVYNNRALSALDLTQNPELTTLRAGLCDLGNHILDLSFNHKLDSLSIFDVKQLLIRNGSVESFLEFRSTNRWEYVCVDENQYEEVRGLVRIEVPVNSFCYYDERSQFTLHGSNYLSTNGIDCNGSTITPAIRFHIDNGHSTGYLYPQSDLSYTSYLPEGEVCITPSVHNLGYYQVIPEKLTLSLPQDGPTYNQDFCVIPNREVSDLEIDLLPLSDARPGFVSDYMIVLRNMGTVTDSGRVILEISDQVSTFVEVDSVPNSINGAVVIWEFSDLQPFQTIEQKFSLELNSPMDSPPLNGRDTLSMSAQVETQNDVNIENNFYSLEQVVVNSFDPNDKICLEGETINSYNIAPYLRYRIRFENTGSADAVHILINDFIDSNKFDLESIIPLHSSHDMNLRVVDGNAEFVFSEINLPFEDDHNDGYVFFKVKPREDLMVGDTISNTAEIFFDFNFPILTLSLIHISEPTRPY